MIDQQPAAVGENGRRPGADLHGIPGGSAAFLEHAVRLAPADQVPRIGRPDVLISAGVGPVQDSVFAVEPAREEHAVLVVRRPQKRNPFDVLQIGALGNPHGRTHRRISDIGDVPAPVLGNTRDTGIFTAPLFIAPLVQPVTKYGFRVDLPVRDAVTAARQVDVGKTVHILDPD